MSNLRARNVLPNIRDLGNLRAGPGRRTVPGILYRSASPLAEDLPPTDLPQWPARTVIDLRSNGELTTSSHPLDRAGTTVHLLPLLDDEELGLLPRGDLGAIYRVLVQRAARQLARVVRLAAAGDSPVLIHCAAGKDRTGIAISLLLCCAGVSCGDIVADYTRSRLHLDAVMARMNAAANLPPHDERDVAGSAYGISPDALAAVLELWSSHPGGVRGWLCSHGTGPETVDRWVSRFVA